MDTPFGTQLIGQAEKTMNAILDRLLAGDVTEPEWVTLVLIAGGAAAEGRDQLTARVAHATKVSPRAAAAQIGQLAGKGLVRLSAGPGSAVALTEAGEQLVGRVRRQAGEVTERLWGDLPAADLEVAGRVLNEVLRRAEAELAARS